jgi:hypothetical protein
MTYKEKQEQRYIEIRDIFFNDPGFGYFMGKLRPFVLQNPLLNLWEGIREDALHYFTKNKIGWWGNGFQPTGHMLSSQVACVNHLFLVRKREDLATTILKGIDPSIDKALILQSGYLEFEMLGKKKLGGEKLHSRGANCTSIDAMMLGQRENGEKVIVLIEWKYTEDYTGTSDKSTGSSGAVRHATYQGLLTANDSPITHRPSEDMYFEPFYQLMRQTLLGKQMADNGDYGASDYLHVDVIPKANAALRNTVTSPKLIGQNMHKAWLNCLNSHGQNRYKLVSNKEFLSPILDGTAKDKFETHALHKYLNIRYF